MKNNLMPILFIGHGNPMNALGNNIFFEGWAKVAKIIPKPEVILCISAHWQTNGEYITAMDKPVTIHDFNGFPEELYKIQYPAKGSPETAARITAMVKFAKIKSDFTEWGLDHGTWSILKPMYPNADIPVIQLSIDLNKPAEFHYTLAQELKFLREEKVLIIGSGNIVHNLGMMQFKSKPYDWAIKFDNLVKELILKDDHNSLVHYAKIGKEAILSIPTSEHYLPMIYCIGMKEKDENVTFFNEEIDLASVSMRSFIIGVNQSK